MIKGENVQVYPQLQDMKITKRNGETVSFDAEKVQNAMNKAFIAAGAKVSEEIVRGLTKAVITEVTERFVSFSPNVENVQDIVEKKLMESQFYDAAKKYILYRKEHETIREAKKVEAQKKIQTQTLKIVKASGEEEFLDEGKIKGTVEHAVKGYEDMVDVDSLVMQCKEQLYEGISTREIARTLMMTARSWIEKGMPYSFITSRLLLNQIYREAFGKKVEYQEFGERYSESFINNLKKGVEWGVLTPELLTFDLDALSKALKPERDELFAYLGLQTLTDRYFMRDVKEQRILETPQAFWMRVAMGLAIKEKEKTKKTLEFYEVMSTLRYVPSTPTLFHSGTSHPQLSSCYLTTIEDDLKHIFKCIGDNAQLAKWSGGIGNDWTNIRGTGALVKGSRVNSNGIVPFLKITDTTTAAINRSGKRRGATCAYLETWHLDIEDFLELRKNTGDERRRTPDMNTSNWIPDLFMKRVMNDGEWTLFSPNNVSDLHHLYGKKFEKRYEEYERLADEGKIKLWKRMKAKDLWRKMITMLFETGHPWITFKDPCNIRSPQDHAGVIHSSNLCTEITLNTSKDETAVCNLGSVNLARHMKENELDKEQIKETVTTAMRMLDNVIDVNFYPTVEGKNANMKHRPVGLGLMGFQDALFMMDVPFDSEACVKFASESMEAIAYYGILASAELAKERGTYESYAGSKWDRGIFPVDTLALLEEERGMKIDVSREESMDWSVVREAVKKYGVRNSNCFAMAPTATIANIAGVFPTIEPIYKNLYVKANQSGDFTVVNEYLIEDLRKHNLLDPEMLGKIKYADGSIQNIKEIPEELRKKYKEAFEIGAEWLVKAAAERGKWIDQSQSFNVFFNGTSGKELVALYQYVWALGLKTTYYLRTLALSQVEKSTVNIAEFGVTHQRSEKRKSAGTPGAPTPSVVVAGPVCEACE